MECQGKSGWRMTGGIWLEILNGRGDICQAGKGLVLYGFGGKFRN